MNKRAKVVIDFLVTFVISFLGLIFASLAMLSKSFDLGADERVFFPSEKFPLYIISNENIEIKIVSIFVVSCALAIILSIVLYALRRNMQKYLTKKGMN